MSITGTISRIAATDPTVGVAVADASTKAAIVAGMQAGDSTFAPILGELGMESITASRLLDSLSATQGTTVDTQA